MKVILASSSKNREKIFKQMNIQFEIYHPDYEENICEKNSPVSQIKEFSLGKSKSVYKKFEQEKNVLILGFDSMIDFENKSLGKPKNREKAFSMLKSFVGKPQNIMTGVSMIGNFNGEYFEEVFHESSLVVFRSNITDEEIKKYLDFGDWEGKCGSYSILGTGVFFLEKIRGDWQNIVGVPIHKIGEKFREIFHKSPIEILKPKDNA